MKHSLLIALAFLGSQAAFAETIAELSPQTVKADFRQTDVQQLPEATTVIGSDQIQARSAEHLEQILSFAPNVNFSSGSSRARYYQIRGVGDRSQFIDPVNPSVGLYIDGIDMTGLGAAATLFDVDQVEVLRGPQGTRFGANALGGLINITSADPTKETEGYLALKAGNYNSYGAGGALSGSLNDQIQGRIAVHHFGSDGYMQNDYLNKDNTQDINETLVRTKFLWQPTVDSELKFTFLYANIDNGYDAFTLDNSRHSLADEPGKDRQETQAWALTYKNILSRKVQFESTISGSHNDSLYSFDEDWVHPELHPDTYSSFDQYERTYKRGAVDMRFISGSDGRIFNNSTDWVLGFYGMTREDELVRNTHYKNNLDARSVSIYSEFTTTFSPSTRLIYGVRFENWENKFEDSNLIKKDTDEWLIGSKVTLEHLLSFNHLSYLSYARGYKPGGVNSDPVLVAENRVFDAETNHAYELGLKSAWLEDAWQTRLALFYIDRSNQQAKNSQPYQDPNGKPKFKDYLANATKGENYGLELESRWQLHERLLWELSYGYLHTEFKDYSFAVDGLSFDKTGRAQSHAPNHSGSTAFTFGLTSALALRLEAEAKDKFYFSDSHDEMAHGYVLYHARLSFTQPRYELALSGRNLSNKDTETRGFGGFGNDPRDGWIEHKYVQLGEPRLVMLEGKLKF